MVHASDTNTSWMRGLLCAGLLAVCGCGGEQAAAPERLGGLEAPLSYGGGGVFTNEHLTHNTSFGYPNGGPKQYLFRVTRGQPVQVALTKLSGNGDLRVKLEFASSVAGPWVPGTGTGCGGGVSITVPSPGAFTCSDSGTGDGFALATVYVNQTSGGPYTAMFNLGYTFTGPCDDAHSCYGLDRIRVGNLTQTVKKPTVPNGVVPGMYEGQSAVVTITRSHANVGFATGGVKFKYMEGPLVAEVDVACGAWGSNTMTCQLNNVPEDGQLHIPLKLTNSTTSPARSATVAIQRSGPDYYVRDDQTWSNF